MEQMAKKFLYEVARISPLLLVIGGALWFFGDGAQLAVQFYRLSMVALVMVFMHVIRKTLFPYVDLAKLVKETKDSPVGSAIIFAAVIALLIAVLSVSAHASMLDRAETYLPTLRNCVEARWPAAPMKEAFAAQIEQESQWKEHAELKTSREYGFGLAQITVTPRFNTFKDAQRIAALKGWQWEDRFNPRYQMTYLILCDRGNFGEVKRLFGKDEDRWAGALVAYNAGLGTVLQRRALAKVSSPQLASRWFGGLDGIRLKYEKNKLYGRNLGDMRNEYPRLILRVRAPKYRGLV